MRLYPQRARRRNRQIASDVVVALSLLLLALFARMVRTAVLSLTAISEGFTSGTEDVRDSWSAVGSTLARVPFVGDDLQGAAQDLSDATLGNALQAGQSITDAVTTTANVLAFVTFAAPAAVLLVLWLPRRLGRAQAWTAAEQVLSAIEVGPAIEGGPVGEAGRGGGIGRAGGAGPGWGSPVGQPARDGVVAFPPDELLALRALCDLPFVDLVRFTPRPFEAFSAGDYAPLIGALYAHEGLEPPA
jgi:hypothetical protein